MKTFFFTSMILLRSILVTAQAPDSTMLKTNATLHMRQLSPAAGLMLSGILLNGHRKESLRNEIVEERNEHIPHFHTHLDDFLQYSPIVMAYGMDIAGVKSKTDFWNRNIILLKSEILMSVVVTALKHTTHQLRPDGSTYNSFPSGHTAQAFTAATFLTEEYGSKYKWMPYAAYSLAASVGSLRMANNRHYLSDVLMGAGIGIFSVKISYWTHRYKWDKNRHGSIPKGNF